MDSMSTVQQVLVAITAALLATFAWIYHSRRSKPASSSTNPAPATCPASTDGKPAICIGATATLKGKRQSGTSILPTSTADAADQSAGSDSLSSSISSLDRDGADDESETTSPPPSLPEQPPASSDGEPPFKNFHSFTKDTFTEDDMNAWPLGGGCPMAAMFGDLGDKDTKKSDRDPKEFCDHIQSEIKKAEQNVTNRQAKDKLTPQQIEDEKVIQREQVEAIYKLMSQDGEKYGISSVSDMHNQMKLYM